MFKKSFYLTAIALFQIFSISYAAIDKAEVRVQLKIGDKVDESTIVIDSESYTQLSMKNEALGFALKLAIAEEGNERIETVPTYNKKHINMGRFLIGEGFSIDAGLTINGHLFEKDLVIRYLIIKKIS